MGKYEFMLLFKKLLVNFNVINWMFWKIVIIDDEEGVYDVIKLMLKIFNFEDCLVEFLLVYSGEEGFIFFREILDIVLVFVDVVMEIDDVGLKFVDVICNEFNNYIIWLILCIG